MFRYALLPLLELSLVAAVPAVALGQLRSGRAPLSDRRVSYEIEAVLDPPTKTVAGSQILTWRNPGPAPVSELQFHLYLNGFRDDRSTYMQESGGWFRGMRGDPEDRGRIDITSLDLLTRPTDDVPPAPEQTVDLTDRIVFIQPDDDNPHDMTAFSLALPRPVMPGREVRLHFEFESVLPRVFARTGWDETASGNLFFMVGQWFPKIAIYEIPGQRYVPEDAVEGRWNTHQFHANSEFYADFGTYLVSIDVPAEYVVGATGERVSEETTAGRKRVEYQAFDVHDFAWTASPDFREHTAAWNGVSIRALMLPEHERYASRMIEATKIVMERMDEWVGPYPYPNLTIVDAIGGAVGMEYPTLFTAWTHPVSPEFARIPIEGTVVHEFIHQYFYGILANNEFEEAWLDEGFTSYFEARVMDAAYPGGSLFDVGGIEIDAGEGHRLLYTKINPGRGAIYSVPWEQSAGVYSRTAYYKPSVVLGSLEQLIGPDSMLRIFRTYYERWSFRHPTTRDFISIVEEIAREDLSWFFEQFVYGTAVVDYRVDRIANRPVSIDDTTLIYDSEVVLERAADGVFPVTVRAHFSDGTYRGFHWDGSEQWHTISTTGQERIIMAEVDPRDEVKLDINRLNNRLSIERKSQFAREMQLTLITVLQHLFYLVTGLF